MARWATVLADPQLRAMVPSAEDVAFTSRATTIESVAAVCDRYADRPAVGTRAPGEAGFQTLSYGELWRRVVARASGWSRRGLLRAGDFVGLCGFTGVDYVVSDLACLYLGAVSVPLQPSLPVEDLAQIARETRLVAVVVNAQHAPLAARFVTGNTAVLPMDGAAIEADGRAGPPARMALPGRDLPADALRTIVYTSGSSAKPKGVVYPERLWRQVIGPPGPRGCAFITVGYLPLCHVFGRSTFYLTFKIGGLTCFTARDDLSALLEDIRLVRPTYLPLVPRVAGMIYHAYQTEVVRRGGGRPDARARVTHEVEAALRDTFLGDRLCGVMASSAPTAPEILAFLRRCFDVEVADVYASSELGIMAVDGRIPDGVAYQLADVPELGYTARDRPYPRGELCVRSATAAPGYFGDAQATALARDADGFMRTGDIVEERGPRRIALVDRRQNIIKLANGEFVSPARLEEIYVASSPFIDQMYLQGDARWPYLLAVVVPNQDSLRLEAQGDAKQLLRRELDLAAQAARLPAHEVPRDFLVESEPFSVENRLLTEANKPRRAELRARYGPGLQALAAAITERQLAASPHHAEEGVAARVRRTVASCLGLTDADVATTTASFAGLGGDSFAAVELCAALEEALGVAVPVAVVLDPSAELSSLIRRIEALAARDGEESAGFAQLHGAGATWASAHDLALARFLGDGWQDAARALPMASAPKTVLLTGASGFVGRSLLVELLERTPGRVIALVRGGDDEAARARLMAGMGRGALAERLARASDRLTVVAGDVARPRLGLSAAGHARLADELDAVVHAAALVNHALPYAELVPPNVAGTAEIVRLALTTRRKRIAFVSSIAIAAGLGRRVLERETAAEMWPRRPVAPGVYGLGYATSKWAAEVLLAEAAARAELPVTIFRCGLVLMRRDDPSQLNRSDMLCRLVSDIVATGRAPATFYVPGKQHGLDAISAEVAAASMAALALAPASGLATYHVTERQAATLDDVVEWIRAAGVTVDRVADQAEWLRLAEAPTLDDRAFREARERLGLGEAAGLDGAYVRALVRALGQAVVAAHSSG